MNADDDADFAVQTLSRFWRRSLLITLLGGSVVRSNDGSAFCAPVNQHCDMNVSAWT